MPPTTTAKIPPHLMIGEQALDNIVMLYGDYGNVWHMLKMDAYTAAKALRVPAQHPLIGQW